jgi:hypothetical protein
MKMTSRLYLDRPASPLTIAPSLTKDVFARLKRRALVDLCCFSECLVDRHFYPSQETTEHGPQVLIPSSRHAPNTDQ